MIVFLNELENEMVIQHWNFKIPVLNKKLGEIFMNSTCFPSMLYIGPYRSFPMILPQYILGLGLQMYCE